MAVLCAGCGEDGPATPERSCESVFSYAGDGTETEVALVGDFNDWAPAGYELERTSEDVYERSFTLSPGRHAYRFLVDGEETLDVNNPLTLFDDADREHSARVVGDCAIPALAVKATSANASSYRAAIRFERAYGGAELDPERLVVTLDGEKSNSEESAERGIISITLSPPTGKHVLRVSAADRDGLEAEAVELPFWIEEEAFTWKDAVIYQIVVDRFRKGDGELDADAGITRRMGGDYAGIVEALDEGYFEKLGANTIWIGPADTNVDGLWKGFDGREYESYHGYWPVEFRRVDPRWGGEDALSELVASAHGAGMRVILDVVPNHVHIHHPYFTEHRGEWFNHPAGDCVCGRECSWNTDIEFCWFTDYLPDLDWTSGAVLDAVIPDLTWWLERFNLDGLRIDAVAMMPRLVTRYLRYASNRTAGQGGRHVYLIGETFTGSEGRAQIRQYLGPQGLSGQFDFPLMWALRSVLAQGGGRMADLLDAYDESVAAWEGSGAVMGHILGNHDVPRFLSLANGDPVDDSLNPPSVPTNERPYRLLALGFAFLLTLPGAPVIYYGDEFGQPGAGDPDNRRPMRFDADRNENEAALAETVSRLGRLRRALPAFRYGERTDLLREPDRLAYALAAGESGVVVVLSRSGEAGLLDLECPDFLSKTNSRSMDCMGGDLRLEANRLRMTLPPFAIAVIADEEVCHASD